MGIESYNPSASLNTSLGGKSVAEGMARGDVSDSIRQLMADIAGGVVPVAHPKKYGAVGDGVADDTTAIQAAINSLPGGGVVLLAKGSYKISATLTMPNPATKFCGEGSFASRIEMTTLNTPILSVTGTHCHLHEFSVHYSGTPVAGATAILINAEYVSGSGFLVRNAHIGVLVQTAAQVYLSQFTVLDYESVGVSVVGPVFDAYFTQFYLNCGNKLRGGGGAIRIYNQCEAVVFSDGECLEGVFSLVMDAATNSNGVRPAYIRFTNVFFDSSDYGTYLKNSVLTTFTNCWFSNGRKNLTGSQLTVDQPACSLAYASDCFSFIGCQFVSGGSHGCAVESPAKRVRFIGCDFNGNSAGAGAGVSHGVLFAAATTDFVVKDCAASNGLGAGSQGYGICVGTGASDRYIIHGNLVSGNATGGVFDGGTGVNKQVANNY